MKVRGRKISRVRPDPATRCSVIVSVMAPMFNTPACSEYPYTMPDAGSVRFSAAAGRHYDMIASVV